MNLKKTLKDVKLLEKIINKKTELQDFIMDVDLTEYEKHEKLENETIKKVEDLTSKLMML